MNNYSSKLAILGGTPVFDKMPSLAWPLVDEATEQDMVALYRSKAWSWNGKWEQHAATELARIHTAKYAILMVNGTVTLEAALKALGVCPGDEVIVPALTWPATALAVLYTGAVPVFVDIQPDTMCIDPERIAEAITPRTKAIIPVHIYGSMADMDAILEIAGKHGLSVIEDCAHAQGGSWAGKGLGSIGDIGSISFQQSKTLSAGEGGAVLTNDGNLADRMYAFKHIGYSLGVKQGKAASKPPEDMDCHNYRFTEFGALALRGQLERLKGMTERRGLAADFLTAELEKLPGVKVQAKGRRADEGCQSYYAFMMTFDPEEWGGAPAAKIMHVASVENLPGAITYGPVYQHALWNTAPSRYRVGTKEDPSCSVAEKVVHPHTGGVLHMLLDLPKQELQKIVDTLAKVQKSADYLARIE